MSVRLCSFVSAIRGKDTGSIRSYEEGKVGPGEDMVSVARGCGVSERDRPLMEEVAIGIDDVGL